MQLHQLKPTIKHKDRKLVGRVGKKGTFSGRGSKGQKSRAGHRIRPGFRGGDNPLWKLFPKQRGAGKKTDIKHAFFQLRRPKPSTVSLEKLDSNFHEGDKVTAKNLVKKGIVRTAKNGIKILGTGELKKKLIISKLKVSAAAREKILKAGGEVN
ncbi:MAG: 50S ribosomal protein L15 [Patescibacteria group bacterium]